MGYVDLSEGTCWECSCLSNSPFCHPCKKLVSKSGLIFSFLDDRSLGEMSSSAPLRAVVENMSCGVSCGWGCQRGAPLWRQKSQNPSFPSAECSDTVWVCCSAGLVNSSSGFRKGKARNSFSLLFVLQDEIQCLSALPDLMGRLFPGCPERDDLEQTEFGFFLLQL